MTESVQVKVRAELSVDADQQVPVERRRDAEWVVVRGDELVSRFHQIGADEQRVAGGERAANAAEEGVGAGWIEISDVRSEKQHERSADRTLFACDLRQPHLVR